MPGLFEGKRILVTGGTGSLGQVLTRRLLAGEEGVPDSVTVGVCETHCSKAA